MKKLIAILFFCSMHLCERSQQKNIPILDTLELPKIEFKKMVLIQENATMLISSGTDF
jgi:hypothetical protein